MKLNKFILATSAVAFFSAGVQATPSNDVQSTINTACFNEHVAAGTGSPTANSIEETCSSDNPGSTTSASSISEKQAAHIGEVLTEALGKMFTFTSRSSENRQGSLYSKSSGLNAGSSMENMTVWGSANWSESNDSFVNTVSSSNTQTAMVGINTFLDNNVLVGLSGGIQDTDVDTTYNGGSMDVRSLTIAGIAGYQYNDNLSVSGMIGFSDVSTNQTRVAVALLPGSLTGGVKSDVDATRWFAGINLDAFTRYNSFFLSGGIGYLMSRENQDNFTERDGTGATRRISGSDSDLNQWTLSGEVAYDAGGTIEPYAGLTYRYKSLFEKVNLGPALADPANDADSSSLSLGMRYFSVDGLSGTFELSHDFGESDIDGSSFMATVQFDL